MNAITKMLKKLQDRMLSLSMDQGEKLCITSAILLIAMPFVIIVLAGCATVPEPVVVTKTQYVTIELPPTLLEKCNVTKPPSVDAYLAGKPIEKEALMADYAILLLKDLQNCNSQLNKLAEAYLKQHDLLPKDGL